MFLFSFIKSFVLYPNHYEWAAFQRDGIGLSYLFGLGVFLTVLAMIFFPFPIEAMFMAEIDGLNLPAEISENLSAKVNDYTFLFYPIIIAIFALGYALSIFNIALLLTIFISQPINYITTWAGEDLTFLQLLRIACYSCTAAFIFSALAVKTLGYGLLGISLIYLFYICAPIIYLKFINDL